MIVLWLVQNALDPLRPDPGCGKVLTFRHTNAPRLNEVRGQMDDGWGPSSLAKLVYNNTNGL